MVKADLGEWVATVAYLDEFQVTITLPLPARPSLLLPFSCHHSACRAPRAVLLEPTPTCAARSVVGDRRRVDALCDDHVLGRRRVHSQRKAALLGHRPRCWCGASRAERLRNATRCCENRPLCARAPRLADLRRLDLRSCAPRRLAGVLCAASGGRAALCDPHLCVTSVAVRSGLSVLVATVPSGAGCRH